MGAVRSGMHAKLRDFLKLLLLVLVVLFGVEAAARLMSWPAAARATISGPADALLAAKRAQGNPFVLVLGDSVMGSSAMESAGVADAYINAIPWQFERMLKPVSVNVTVTNLAMDGALVGDYLGLLQLLTEHQLRPAAAVIQVDYRLLSPLHDNEDRGNFSRAWLLPYVAPWTGLLTLPNRVISPSERPIDDIVGRSMLLRSDAYLRLRNLHARFLAAQPAAIADANRGKHAEAVRLTVGRYYLNESDITAGATLSAFAALMDRLRSMAIPTVVCFTPANPGFLGDQLNQPVYAYNVHAFGEWFRRRYGSTPFLRLVSLENIFADADFLDHSHLTAAANARAAKIMFDEFVLLNQRRN